MIIKMNINDINFTTKAIFDNFFTEKVKNYDELVLLLEEELLPSFIKKSFTIIEYIQNLIKADDYHIDLYFNYIPESSYMNLLLYANIKDERINIGYFFFNNYLNKSTKINIDINLDFIGENGLDLIPLLENMPNYHTYDLSELKHHFCMVFEHLKIDDYHLDLNKSPLERLIFGDKAIEKRIDLMFSKQKEIDYFNSLREKFPIIKNYFKNDFEVTNIVNKKGIFKMICFSYNNPSQYVDSDLLTKVFINLNSSIEDSFIRGFIYVEFFTPLVIESYLSNENMTLDDMLDIQSITEY